jgi:hypothetical protein
MNKTTFTPAKPWTVVKDITSDGITVRITAQDGYRPKYSVSLGRIVPSREPGGDPRFAPHLAMYSESNLGKASVRWNQAMVAGLLASAHDWILLQCQNREDAIIEEKQHAERHEANRNKPETRRTGKTEKNKNKGVRP